MNPISILTESIKDGYEASYKIIPTKKCIVVGCAGRCEDIADLINCAQHNFIDYDNVHLACCGVRVFARPIGSSVCICDVCAGERSS